MNKMYRIEDINNNLSIARFRPLDVLVVGGTGAGKSSTLNALFEDVVVTVGEGCNPQTMEVDSNMLNESMRFWDSPGLGDNIGKDLTHSKKLVDLLYRDYCLDHQTYGLIDTVLVILDGSNRDLGTTYKLLNEVIAPNFQVDRLLIAINQADLAMKGRHWDSCRNCPDDVLLEYLESKTASVQSRLYEATGITVVKPVYYSAAKNYHIRELLDLIIDNMPRERRPLKR